jgi:hypothetical protein
MNKYNKKLQEEYKVKYSIKIYNKKLILRNQLNKY